MESNFGGQKLPKIASSWTLGSHNQISQISCTITISYPNPEIYKNYSIPKFS